MPGRLAHIMSLLLLALTAAPAAYAQYFSRLYDYDSSGDLSINVRMQADGSYLVMGLALNETTFEQGMQWMVIAKDGSSVGNKHGVFSSFGPYFIGLQGRMKSLSTGGYILPITQQRYKSLYTPYSRCGLAKLNNVLDTVFVKFYTDTARNFEDVQDVIELPGGQGYMLAGEQADTSVDSFTSVLLLKTDTNGNILWKHTYRKTSGNNEKATSISLLADGRILVGAYMEDLEGVAGDVYYRHTPWFMLLDTTGKLLKDRVWSVGFTGGATVFPDANGGYIHFGIADTILKSPSTTLINFPCYLAHIDTNFLPEWTHRFPSNVGLDINTTIENVRQLKNGEYLVVGKMLYDYPTSHSADRGWAVKLDRAGNVLWERNYEIDTNQDCELTDAQERADGSIILTGAATNTALPAWRYQDVWLLSIDSNGCEMPGCALQVPVVQNVNDDFKVYPNPIINDFTMESANAGMLEVYDAAGRRIAMYNVQQGISRLRLPDVSSGIYIGRYMSTANGETKMLRLVKE